ncbi:transposase, partial [Klebsiella pneumoniae]
CWVHKTANVLNRLPKASQPRAKKALQAIWHAETREDAEKAFDTFITVTVKVSVALLNFYAAICSIFCTCFRSGFNDTTVPGSQLRVSPLQRS